MSSKVKNVDYSSICNRLASRYKSNHHNDLVQEGLLAVYEEIDKTAAHLSKPRAIQVAKHAMWVYHNLKTKPVSVPERQATYLLQGNDVVGGYTTETLDWLSTVLSSPSSVVSDDALGTDEDYEKEILQEVWEIIYSLATPRDAYIMVKIYKEGRSDQEVSSELGISRQAVNQATHKVLDLLRDNL